METDTPVENVIPTGTPPAQIPVRGVMPVLSGLPMPNLILSPKAAILSEGQEQPTQMPDLTRAPTTPEAVILPVSIQQTLLEAGPIIHVTRRVTFFQGGRLERTDTEENSKNSDVVPASTIPDPDSPPVPTAPSDPVDTTTPHPPTPNVQPRARLFAAEGPPAEMPTGWLETPDTVEPVLFRPGGGRGYVGFWTQPIREHGEYIQHVWVAGREEAYRLQAFFNQTYLNPAFRFVLAPHPITGMQLRLHHEVESGLRTREDAVGSIHDVEAFIQWWSRARETWSARGKEELAAQIEESRVLREKKAKDRQDKKEKEQKERKWEKLQDEKYKEEQDE
jgi:hypothetical protein